MVVNTQIHLFGFLINEPVTVLTDIIISLMCWYFAYRLNFKSDQQKMLSAWKLFILTLGISSFFGGISHALTPDTAERAFFKLIQNFTSLYSNYYLFLGIIYIGQYKEITTKRLKLYTLILILVIAVVTYFINKFIVILICSGITVILGLLQNYKAHKLGFKGCGKIALGFLISVGAIIIFLGKISFSKWFNHNDFSHIVVMASITCIFLGVIGRTRISLNA